MPAILLIEDSATIRQIQGNLLIKAGYQVTSMRDFDSVLARFDSASSDLGLFDAAVLGWSESNAIGAPKVLGLLDKQNIPVLVLDHEQGVTLQSYLQRRPQSAFLLWRNYKQSPDVLARLILQANERGSVKDSAGNILQPIRVLFVDDSRSK